MDLLSSVRMGVNLGLIENLQIPTINKLFIHTQPAHLQKLRGTELDTANRNIERAHYCSVTCSKTVRIRPKTTDPIGRHVRHRSVVVGALSRQGKCARLPGF